MFDQEMTTTSYNKLYEAATPETTMSLIHNDVKNKLAALFGGLTIFSSTGAFGEKFFNQL